MKKLHNTPLLALAAFCLILGACAHTTDVASEGVPPNENGVSVIPIDQTSASVGSTTSSTMNTTGPQSRLAADIASMKNGDNNTGSIVTRTGTTVVTRTDTPPSTASVSYRDENTTDTTTSVSGTSGTSVSGSTDNTASMSTSSTSNTTDNTTSSSSGSMTSNSTMNDQQDTTSTTSTTTTTSRTRLRKD
jgi:hypothetical protein